jgi:hypothetical protein
MRKRRALWAAWLASGTAALIVGVPAPAPADASVPLPVGPQFQINTYQALFQDLPSVAVDASGNFVVVWSCDGQSGTDTGSLSIQGHRYASDGTARGAQFQVNTYTTGDQRNASVAMDAGGSFVVVWESNGSDGTDTSYRSVQGQRFASDGSPLGGQFQVNTYTPQSQLHASVAAEPDGDFVVVWDSNGSPGTDTSYRSIQGQRYAADGSAQGAQFQVNTYTMNYQMYPSVAGDADGDIFVVWQSYGSSGTDQSGLSVQGQRYASDGSAQGAEFQVNTHTEGLQRNASVAGHVDGDFVVVWESYGSSGTDASGFSVQGQRYASDGSAQGAEFQVNSYTTGDQANPSVATDAEGEFVVVWNRRGSSEVGTSKSVRSRRYASDGSAKGEEFRVNTETTGTQYLPFVAAESDGDFVVVWRSDVSGEETSDSSIQGQRYSQATAVPAMSSDARLALAAGMLVLGAACALRRCAVSARP